MIFRPYFLSVAGLVGLAIGPTGAPQSSANSSPTQNTKSQEAKVAKGASGEVNSPGSNVYRNTAFGFRYDVILGWVDRTSEMQSESKASDLSSNAQGKVLLAVFERPPEVSSENINSGVVIAQESAASYPGLKSAVDYVGPLTELATRSGFKTAGEPAAITIDSKELVECDFTRENGKVPAYQSTLILLQKGMIVSFTFIGASADEVKSLMERLSFQRPAAAKPK